MTSGSAPCWQEEVQPFRKEATFWHSVWHSARDLLAVMDQYRNQDHQLEELIKTQSIGEVMKITGGKVKEAAGPMKNG